VGSGTGVARLDERPYGRHHLADVLIQKVQRRLLIRKETAVEHLSFVPGVTADDGKSAGERRHIPGGHQTIGWRDNAIEATASLVQQPTVPGFR
jgi:hypothetical protein